MNQLTDLLRQSALAAEVAEARITGLAACKCGRQQWTRRGMWIAQDAIGTGLRDEYDGEPITETACVMCMSYCRADGTVTALDMDFTAADTRPVETSHEEEWHPDPACQRRMPLEVG